MSKPVVTITDGALQGYVEDGISIFKGIPFAKPPIRELADSHWSLLSPGLKYVKRRI